MYDLTELYDIHMAGKAADAKAATEQAVELELLQGGLAVRTQARNA